MSYRYAVILVENPSSPGDFLMGRRRDNGKINFPAGGINDGEDPKAGAARELKEETGFTAASLKLVGVYSKKDKQNKPIIVYTYRASTSGEPDLQSDPDEEFQSLFWTNPLNVPEDQLHIKPEENSGLKALKV